MKYQKIVLDNIYQRPEISFWPNQVSKTPVIPDKEKRQIPALVKTLFFFGFIIPALLLSHPKLILLCQNSGVPL